MLLENVKAEEASLHAVVVVDSSEDRQTEILCQEIGMPQLKYIKSEPGLPRQRNAGIGHMLGSHEGEFIISFLDDDVRVPSGYFESVRHQFEAIPESVCIAGFDLNLTEPASSLIHRLFFLREKNDQGKVLKSGIAIPVYHPTRLVECDWAPGHSLNIRASALRKVQFNSSIRMYGEDVEFLLRLGQVGKIHVGPPFGVWHNQEPGGREGAAAAEGYNAGFRYSLATVYPKRFSKYRVLVSTACLMVGYFLKGLVNQDKVSSQRAKGLFLFFYRLALRKSITQ